MLLVQSQHTHVSSLVVFGACCGRNMFDLIVVTLSLVALGPLNIPVRLLSPAIFLTASVQIRPTLHAPKMRIHVSYSKPYLARARTHARTHTAALSSTRRRTSTYLGYALAYGGHFAFLILGGFCGPCAEEGNSPGDCDPVAEGLPCSSYLPPGEKSVCE
jgi:hypothetical protein